MTLAEQYSTSEPPVTAAPRKASRKRVFAILVLAATIGTTTTAISSPHPASADQISDAKAQAAAITAKIQATEGQIAALSGQVQSADYQLSQLNSQIAANQAEVQKDQAAVAKDQSQLRTQAISDYTSSGTTNQVTQMFSSSPNTSDIRSEYSSIATGNVTTTIDNLHTAQSQLQAAQSALQQQQSQQTATRNSLQASEGQATALANQDQATLNSVNANIQNLVAQQQAAQAAAAKAAATASFNAKLAAAQRAQSATQTTRSSGISAGGVTTCRPERASATGGVRRSRRGTGRREPGRRPLRVGRRHPGRLRLLGPGHVGLCPGRRRAPPHLRGAVRRHHHIALADIEPGDLLFYGPGGSEHVAMYVGGGSMVEAPYTGASVWITGVRTDGGFVGVGRVG